jgi:hypothetical protein
MTGIPRAESSSASVSAVFHAWLSAPRRFTSEPHDCPRLQTWYLAQYLWEGRQDIRNLVWAHMAAHNRSRLRWVSFSHEICPIGWLCAFSWRHNQNDVPIW